jgi:hypothetical protein
MVTADNLMPDRDRLQGGQSIKKSSRTWPPQRCTFKLGFDPAPEKDIGLFPGAAIGFCCPIEIRYS